MATTFAPTIEVPDGYTVVERIGAGGYGEVWKAIAPGGVEKAIKLVFGHCGEDLAERELKSLERIRSVRHPFLLSIERFDIVAGRLVIVTELADTSLYECFRDCKDSGTGGIPREKLLSYLWDTADALDCLAEQHSLQHLDIKPENILIVGDHAKVADFGLVKELKSRTLNSMMGGMTPVYSAPEIFDDNPASQSDQYSLAIVYQQMLTGTLPFAGRTPAQLAKQHTQAVPNVGPLGAADQTAVRRALEKQPSARFASCREFVAALRSDQASPSQRKNSTDRVRPLSVGQESDGADGDVSDTHTTSSSQTQHGVPAEPSQEPRPRPNSLQQDALDSVGVKVKSAPVARSFPQVSTEIRDIRKSEGSPPVADDVVPMLLIGVGGVGIEMLNRAHRTAGKTLDDDSRLPKSSWLAIDVEHPAIESNGIDSLHIPLRRPKQYRDSSQELLRWVSRRWLYNIPRSLVTKGYRPLARIALVDHAADVLRGLHTRIRDLVANAEAAGQQPRLRLVLLAGMSGGTGSGTVIDVAQAVRSACEDLQVTVSADAILGCTFQYGGADTLAAANMFALLTELNHSQQHGNCGENTPPGLAARYERRGSPLDRIQVVALPARNESGARESALDSVAHYVTLLSVGAAGADSDRQQNDWETFTCVDIERTLERSRREARNRLRMALIRYWTHAGSPQPGQHTKPFGHFANSVFARTIAVLADSLETTEPEFGNAAPQMHSLSASAARVELAAKIFNAFVANCGELQQTDEQAQDNQQLSAVTDRVISKLWELLGQAGQTVPTATDLDSLLESEISGILDSATHELAKHSAQVAARQTEIRPLDCGYDRRLTMLTPTDDRGDATLADAFRQMLPTLNCQPAPLPKATLYAQGAGLRPLHLAARIAETIPDIDEAAGRLHAREDIDWRDVRDD